MKNTSFPLEIDLKVLKGFKLWQALMVVDLSCSTDIDIETIKYKIVCKIYTYTKNLLKG